MAGNNKIHICWNDTEYIKDIQKEKSDVKLFTSQDSLNTIAQDAAYIVVLCELLWSHDEKKTHSYSDLNGIKLGQWLRREKKIKIPILFVSFLSRKDILALRPDAEIICTPALKHGFMRLPSSINEWLEKLNGLGKPLTDLELKYTQLRFCDIDGLIKQIRHDISSCYSEEALNERFKILEFAVENKYIEFKSDTNILKENLKNVPVNPKQIQELFKQICNKIIDSDKYGTGN
jgi:hypothetical protein